MPWVPNPAARVTTTAGTNALEMLDPGVNGAIRKALVTTAKALPFSARLTRNAVAGKDNDWPLHQPVGRPRRRLIAISVSGTNLRLHAMEGSTEGRTYLGRFER